MESSLASKIAAINEKVKKSNLPSDLNEKVNTMISLLTVTSHGNESLIAYEQISNYINWVTSIPFNSQTQDVVDSNHAKQVLDKNHYGLIEVKNRILDYLSSIILNLQKNNSENVIRAPILCLIGL